MTKSSASLAQILRQTFVQVTALSIAVFTASSAHAASSGSTDKLWSEVRVFALTRQLATSPDDFNALTSGDNVGSLTKLNGLGFEANFAVGWLMKVGFRAGGTWNEMNSTTSTNTNAFLAVQQGWGGAVVRIPLVNSNLIQFDVFGEGGLAATHIDVSTMNNGSGTFTKSLSPYERAGGSFGIGWKSFYLFAEAGYEWENLDTMSYQGTLSTKLSAINLSSPYYAVGFTVAGLPGFLGK